METLERLNTVTDLLTEVEHLLKELIEQGYKITIAKKLPLAEYEKHKETVQKMTDILNLKEKALSEGNYEYLALLRDRERAVEEWLVFNYAKTTKNYFKIDNTNGKELIFYPPSYVMSEYVEKILNYYKLK